ncbi:hypothetical protein QYE76_023912 [Lolium multiflorum]|uniref:Reverse transcriptase RNase H-like domain-containing protein n=1 Tax=Lolium multiflorum TaxID=4521 RepID=A0AAD8VV79_LOLMU|nr:hypothetical protein QYE76_023912 [Lolium multiflorum]
MNGGDPHRGDIDPAAAQAEAERRARILESGKDVVKAQRELNLTWVQKRFAVVAKAAANMPTTLAEMIRVADNYALGDPTQPALQPEPEQLRQEQHRDNRNNKRREDFPDRRYGPQQVAAVQEDDDASGSRRQRTGSQPWAGPKKQWVEKKPWAQKRNWQNPQNTPWKRHGPTCRWHTPNPAHPSNHLTKDCTWTKYLMEKGAVKDAQGRGGNAMMPPPDMPRQQQMPPPLPLTGPNALPVQPNRQQYQQVNRVEQDATNRVVSVVVVVEREEEGKTVQRPVYYLSEVLSLSKQNYPHFQKMTYGVFMAATKLKHYFEEHPMKVVSEAPISDIMCNKDASGRIAKWAIQISPYVPVYERRDAIKSQALADFLVDWAEQPPDQKIEYWKMHFDGSKLKEGLGAGLVHERRTPSPPECFQMHRTMWLNMRL